MNVVKYYDEFVNESQLTELSEELSEEINYFQSLDNEFEIDESFTDNIKKTADSIYKLYKNVKCWKEKVTDFVKSHKFSKELESALMSKLQTKEYFGMEYQCQE